MAEMSIIAELIGYKFHTRGNSSIRAKLSFGDIEEPMRFGEFVFEAVPEEFEQFFMGKRKKRFSITFRELD